MRPRLLRDRVERRDPSPARQRRATRPAGPAPTRTSVVLTLHEQFLLQRPSRCVVDGAHTQARRSQHAIRFVLARLRHPSGRDVLDQDGRERPVSGTARMSDHQRPWSFEVDADPQAHSSISHAGPAMGTGRSSGIRSSVEQVHARPVGSIRGEPPTGRLRRCDIRSTASMLSSSRPKPVFFRGPVGVAELQSQHVEMGRPGSRWRRRRDGAHGCRRPRASRSCSP